MNNSPGLQINIDLQPPLAVKKRKKKEKRKEKRKERTEQNRTEITINPDKQVP